MKYIYYFSLLALQFSCVGNSDKKLIEIGNKPEQVNSIQKIALKNKTMIRNANGELIETEGVFRYNFEDVAIYPSKQSSFPEAIWLKLPSTDYLPDSVLNNLNGKRITVIGRIDFSDKGHENGYFASLDSVFYIKEIAK
jgi:hypothetical protein